MLIKHLPLRTIATVTALALTMSACSEKSNSELDSEQSQATKNTQHDLNIWPKLAIKVSKDAAIEAKIEQLLSQMTVEQKVAQMIQPEIRDITVEDMRKYGFGSYLNGGGAFPDNNKHATPNDWIKLAEDLYQASIDDSLDGSSIPTMWGTDAVHGHNNVIGATLFPHNIGLGAANNPNLIEKIAAITAKEVMVTGIDWVFAPTVAVVRDDRWGRTYESYSEDPKIVRDYSTAIVNGLQGNAEADFLSDQRVIATVKHFLGDGGTENGDDQGNNIASEQELFDVHAQGYIGGLTAGAQTVMASFNSWHGEKIHGNKYLLTDVLKNTMGFDGLVVGDWNGHGQVKGCTNESCPQAINAGLDIFMVPTGAWKPLYENTLAQINQGDIALSRVDDAVRRILRVKMRAGLFSKPSPANRPMAGKVDLIGAQAHREVARQAVRESLVLLKNKNGILPLASNQHILVAGDGADNIGKQSGGWTITWQGTGNTNADFPGGTSIFAGIKAAVEASGGHATLSPEGKFEQKPDVAIVVFGEEPYAEGNGDLDNLEYQRGNKRDLALLHSLKAKGIPVVSVFLTGRPMWVNPELNASDAFVVAWLPGSEGQGIADVIFSNNQGQPRHDFQGRLSFSWPNEPNQSKVNLGDANYQPLFVYGYGLDYHSTDSLGDELNEQVISANNQLANKPLFENSVKAPWKLILAENQQSAEMTSSVIELANITMKTTDRKVQEDALLLNWLSEQQASISISSPFPSDLRAYQEAMASLNFDIKLSQYHGQPILVEMNCADDCIGQIDVTRLIASLPKDVWQTISIPLTCFADQGVDFSKVFTPFKLIGSSNLQLTLGEIHITPSADKADQRLCP